MNVNTVTPSLNEYKRRIERKQEKKRKNQLRQGFFRIIAFVLGLCFLIIGVAQFLEKYDVAIREKGLPSESRESLREFIKEVQAGRERPDLYHYDQWLYIKELKEKNDK